MRFIIPIILVILSIAMFFGYIDSTYDDVNELRSKVAEFDKALDRSRELIEVRDILRSKYNSFSTEELDRLRKLLPDHIDSVRLVIDIDNIAAQRGLRISNIAIDNKATEIRGENEVGPPDESLGIVGLSFGIDATYAQLKQFLMDLEDSLRIVDIVSLSFGASEEDSSSYSISIRTYWLQ